MFSTCAGTSGNAGLSSLYAAMMPPPRVPVVDIDAIAASAYREGLAAGAAEMELVLAAERKLLAAARAAFATAMLVDRDALRESFVTLAGTLARTIVGAELELNPAVMTQLVDAALAAVVPDAEVVIRVHPDDAHYLDCTAIPDPTLARGSVVVDVGSFVVADSLDARLAALIEALL